MKRLIDADVLYEQIVKKEELARKRVLDTPSMMPNGDLNPSAIRYYTQLDERTQMKFMIADAPTIDAEPVIRCKDCKHQVKEWRTDNRLKDKGYMVCGCDVVGDACGYWALLGQDDDFCSNAEPKETT